MSEQSMNLIRVKVKKLNQNAQLPAYQHSGDAGADLFADVGGVGQRFFVPPHGSRLIDTGLAIQVPMGFEAQIRPRSGLAAKHKITVLNSPGTIDATYTGPLKVLLMNHSDEFFVVNHGDRIAQLVIKPVLQGVWEEVEALDETERGQGGFGSSGK